MNVLDNIYYKGLAENDKNLRYWEQYLHNLRSIDFNVFADKLKVPVLVPIGSRILFRGVIKHTNEVTAALGADYFTKCSVKQAEVLREHRIKDAELKVNALLKEKEYLEGQLSFNRQNVVDVGGHEIVEDYNEAEDKLWREKHRENMKKYKQYKGKIHVNESNVTDKELWERLEELELQEELENEMQNMNFCEQTEVCDNSSESRVKKDTSFTFKKEFHHDTEHNHEVVTEDSSHIQDAANSISKYNLIQKVLEKQQELEEKLFELKNKDRGQSKTESDLLAKLDEMEELDELEDEMDRLDNILENGNIEDDGEEFIDEIEDKRHPGKVKKSTSFADEDDSECLELTFKHSKTSPNTDPYAPNKGILKPSDLYEAYKDHFTATTSILKKSKYDSDAIIPIDKKSVAFADTDASNEIKEDKKTIFIQDIQEKENNDIRTLENSGRPMSLFKMRRQQNKK